MIDHPVPQRASDADRDRAARVAMPPARVAKGVLSWASLLDDATREQAARTAALPFVAGHVALMPDAHLGKGATIGSVIPTHGAIIPAAVGVDIGCGMVAAETVLGASDLPDDLAPLLDAISEAVPAGVGQGHEHVAAGERWLAETGMPRTELSAKQARTTCGQFGTLGSGNHFFEVCLDERDRVWLMLHSGSRGIGNQLAQWHIRRAKGLMQQWFITLADPDLAYFVQGTDDFDHYLADLLWAQSYAAGNRARMIAVGVDLLAGACGREAGGVTQQVVNCHHNYTAKEHHRGRDLWITRKGAILARDGDLGIVPGSMGTHSYIVRGKGSAASYHSCAHGAGRAMSRSEAKRRFSDADLAEAMAGKTWLRERAGALVDEIPSSYKNIDTVMADQTDLVTIEHELRQVLNYKGI